MSKWRNIISYHNSKKSCDRNHCDKFISCFAPFVECFSCTLFSWCVCT